MHIVFVSQIVPYPPHGGVLQRGFNVLRELGKYHHVDLLAYIHPDAFHKETDLEESRDVLGRFCRRVEYFQLWPKRSRTHRYAAYLASLFYPKPFSVLAHQSAALARRLKQMIDWHQPDLVHLDTIGLAPLRDLCGDIPVVLAHHNIESQLMERRALMERTPLRRLLVARQARLLSAYERFQSPLFPLNVMVSEVDAGFLQQMVPEVRTIVVENGVDTDYFRPRQGEETRAVIYTGGMNMFANHDAVLWFLKEVWPRLKEKAPDLRFFAVGQDPPDDIRTLVAADPMVELPGFVDDIRPWVARASVYVVPLRVGGGTRLKVMDAMSQGKAIVSTSVGCEGINVADSRDILIADNQHDFAAHVLSLLQNEEKRTALGRAARQLAEEEYSWPRIARKLMNGYTTLIGK